MNRDGGAERRIWRQKRHLISCTMTCAGGISVKRPPTRCRPTMSGKAKSRPAAALRRKVMAATTNITIRDEDQKDASPSYYEREIDRLDAAIRDRSR